MIRHGILTAAAILALGLSGAAQAQTQLSPQTQDNVGANAAGSKSGVVGKGDSMEGSPATTGTAVVPGTRTAPSDRRMPDDDGMTAPRPGMTAPAR